MRTRASARSILAVFGLLAVAAAGCHRTDEDRAPQGNQAITPKSDARTAVVPGDLSAPSTSQEQAQTRSSTINRRKDISILRAQAPPSHLIGHGHFDGSREMAIYSSPGMRCLAVSPDGKYVAAATQVSEHTTTLKVWETSTGSLMNQWVEPLGITAIAFAPDSQTCAYGAGDHQLVVQPVPAGKATRLQGHSLGVTGIAFSPDGKHLASLGQDNRLIIRNVAEFTRVTEMIVAESGTGWHVRFADPRQLWVRMDDGSLHWFELKGNSLVPTRVIKLPVGFRMFAADGARIFGTQSDQRPRIVSSETGLELPLSGGDHSPHPGEDAALSPAASRVVCITLAADSPQLAIGTTDGRLSFVRKENLTAERSIDFGGVAVDAVAVDAQGGNWAVHTMDGGLRIIDSDPAEPAIWLERSVATGSKVPPALSPDGQTMAALHGLEEVVSTDTRNGVPRRRWRLPDSSAGAATALHSANDHTVYCGTRAGGIYVLKEDGDVPAASFTVAPSGVTALAASPDGQQLLAGDEQGDVIWLDSKQKFAPYSQREQVGAISAMGFSPDGLWAATASDDHSVVLWDVAKRAKKAVLSSHAEAVQAVEFSPDSRWLASGDRQGDAYLWDVATGEQVVSISLAAGFQSAALTASFPEFAESAPQVGTHGITAIAFSPDQRVLAIGSASGYTQTFNLTDFRALSAVHDHGVVCDLAFANDNAWLLSATHSGNLSRWWQAPDPPFLLTRNEGSIRFAALDAAGGRAVIGGLNQQLSVWDVDQKSLIQSLANEGEGITCGALSGDGQRAVTAGFGSGVVFWDLAQMKRLAKRYGHAKRVWALAFSPDGKTVASGCDDKTVKLWDFASQKTMHTLPHDAPVHFVIFSPDGTKVLSSTIDARGWKFPGRLQLWNVATGKLVREFQGHQGNVTAAAVSADGRQLISCGADGQFCRWDFVTGHRILDVMQPDGLSLLNMFRKEPYLVMRRFSNVIFVDHADTLTRISAFNVPTRSITDLNLALMGNRVIAGTEEGAVYLWNVGNE